MSPDTRRLARATSLAVSAAMAVGLLIGYFVIPVVEPEEQQPPRQTYEQQLTECVRAHQSLYDAPRDLSRAICIDYLERQEATP